MHEHVIPESYLELIILISIDNCLLHKHCQICTEGIINARESQMTAAPALKERDVIPSIPVALFALLLSAPLKLMMIELLEFSS